MKLTAKGRYAMQAMVCMTQRGTNAESAPLPLNAISRDQNIPLAYLEQIFYQLGRAGLVLSKRGKNGGFVLAKAPQSITALDVIEAVEEPIKTTGCGPGRKRCTGGGQRCNAHRFLRRIEWLIARELRNTSLFSICEEAVAGQSLPVDKAGTA